MPLKRLRDTDKYTVVEITITEGLNRQVRRMVEAVGSKVLKLVRTGIGGIRIEDDVAVHADRTEVLTRIPRDLIEL